MSQSGLDKPHRNTTEAEGRAAGHTQTPWFPSRHNTGGETGEDIDIEIRPGGWFLRLSPGYAFSKMAYPADAEREFKANVAFTMLAVNSYDAMKAALEALTKNCPRDRAEALKSYAPEWIAALDALSLARGTPVLKTVDEIASEPGALT